MEDSVHRFYEDLAEDYHLLFEDWRQAVAWQGEALSKLIRAQMGETPVSVLDSTCGIGTQAIGLALHGQRVHATDLSAAAVRRAKREARAMGAAVTFGVADVRNLEVQVPGTFDVIISCDNALPHLLTVEDLDLAARNFYAKLNPNGLVLATIRDYDQIVKDKPGATAPRVFDSPEGRRIVFQIWDWLPDGHTYRVHQFILVQAGNEWKTVHFETVYRALLQSELEESLRKQGFADIHWHTPDESGYYQPVVTARKPQ
ncbi:MAG: methyltransferase domain-containing protein [Chloroflexi bacterium]|nr:methyltransferase domain-containing protein [Chloroflexota bacterium]